MFKSYLQEKKISVYKLSEISNIPYTTVNELANGKKNIDDCKIKTIQGLADSLNLTIESLLGLFNDDKVILSDSWEQNKYKKFYFPIIISNDNYECNRIHPLMQKKVNEIYNIIKNYKEIEKVVLFGSSVNIRCNNNSDIDIAIKIKDEYFNRSIQNIISETIGEITNYNCDIVWINTIDKLSLLFNNINTLGVIIYE